MSYAEYLKHIREKNNLSPMEFAKALDGSISGIKAIENGLTKYPTEKMISALSKYLQESPLKVATDILYGEEQKNNTLLYRYIASQYLEGWKIEKGVHEINLWDEYFVQVDACVVHKHDHRNIVFIILYGDYLENGEGIFSKEDALDYIGWIVARLMLVKENYRTVQIVFNKEKEDEVKAYQFVNELDIIRLPFQLNVVLFDCENGEVEKKIYR